MSLCIILYPRKNNRSDGFYLSSFLEKTRLTFDRPAVFIVNRLPVSVWRSFSFAIAGVGSLRSVVYFGISDGYLSPHTRPFKTPTSPSHHPQYDAATSAGDAGRAVRTLFVGSGVDTSITGSEFLQTCDERSQ